MTDLPAGKYQRCVVSICGGSGSGKSTLAKRVGEGMGSDRAVRIPTDYYLQSNPYPTLEEFFQHPLEYDWDLIDRVLQEKDGQVVQVPDYDFHHFRRISLAGSRSLVMRPVVLIDAMIPYVQADLIVFIDASESERRGRIAARDQIWKTKVILNWELHQRTLEYVNSLNVMYDMVLDGRQPVEENAEDVITCIRERRRDK